MQLRIDTFTGMRPAYDEAVPSNSLAVDAVDCQLRKRALEPIRAPAPSQHSVYAGSARLHYDARKGTFFGGSPQSGAATELFPDSELLYVIDGSDSRVLDTHNGMSPIVPIAPVDPPSGVASTSSVLSVSIGNVIPANHSTPENGQNLRPNLVKAASESLDIGFGDPYTFEALILRASQADPADGWWALDDFGAALFSVASKAYAQAHVYNLNFLLHRTIQTTHSISHRLSFNTLDSIARAENMHAMYKARRPKNIQNYAPALFVAYAANNYSFEDYQEVKTLPITSRAWQGGTLLGININDNGDWTQGGQPDWPYTAQLGQSTIADLWWDGIYRALTQGSNLGYHPNTVFDSRPYVQVYDDIAGAVVTEIPDTQWRKSDGSVVAPPYSTTTTRQWVQKPTASVLRTDTPNVPGIPVSVAQDMIDALESLYYNIHYLNNDNPQKGLTGLVEECGYLEAIASSFHAREPLYPHKGGEPIVEFAIGETLLPDAELKMLRAVPVAYCFTWGDSFGRESAPSLPVVAPLPPEGLTPTHTLSVTATPPYGTTTLFLYRAVGNLNATDQDTGARFLRCAVIPVNQIDEFVAPPLEHNESVALETHEHYPVPADAAYARETESGHLVWAANNGTEVHYSYRHVWYATHPGRQIQLPRGWKVMGIEVAKDNVYVITDHKPLLVLHSEDTGIGGLRIDVTILESAPWGCASAASIARTGWGVIYAAETALVALHGNQAQDMSAPFITSWDWKSFAATRCSVYHDGVYRWSTDTTSYALDWPDPANHQTGKDATLTRTSGVYDAMTVGPDGVLYVLPPDGSKLYAWGQGEVIPYTYHTTDTSLPKPTWLTTFYIRGRGDPVRATIYMDGAVVMDRDVPVDTMVRIPRHARGHRVSVKLVGTATVNHIIIASTGTQNDASS